MKLNLSGRTLPLLFSVVILMMGTLAFPKDIHPSQSDTITHAAKVYDHQQVTCLAKNMTFEAGNQSEVGKLAVAAVTVNRVNTAGFPSTICGVVNQKVGKVCQFSWVCMKQPKIDPTEFDKTYQLARDFYHKKIDSPIRNDVIYYHASYLNSSSAYWFKHSLVKVAKIGDHIFYRSKV